MTPVRVMVNTAAVLFVLGLAWLVIHIKPILILLLLGIIFAAAIEPIVYRLRRYGLRRGQAIISVYVALATVLTLTLYLVVPPLIRQVSALFTEIPTIISDLRLQARASDNDFIRTSGVNTLNQLDRAYHGIATSPQIEGSTALGFATSVVGVIFATIVLMIIAFYWMTEKAIIKRLILSFFPMERRDRAHAMWDEIEFKLGGWVRGQLILMSAIGVGSAAGYFALGLEFWLPLAIWAGLTELIPFIGPWIGGGAAVAVALSDSWEKALAVGLFVFVLQQFEGAVLVPRVMHNTVGMTPLTVILAVLTGGLLLGPLGAILAIPVAAAVQVVVEEMLRTREGWPVAEEAGITGAEPMSDGVEPSPAVAQGSLREPSGAGTATASSSQSIRTGVLRSKLRRS